MAKTIKKINPNNIPLTTKVYCACKIIQAYQLCNDCDNLSRDSAVFLDYKEELEQNLQEGGHKAIKKLNKLGVLDENLRISDERLLNKIKELAIQIRDKEIQKITDNLQQNELMDYTKELLGLGDGGFDKLKTMKIRVNPNKLKEDLALDFAEAQLRYPDNELLQQIAPTVKKQTADLPFYAVALKTDRDVNHELYDEFNNTERKKFLTTMGNILWLGGELNNSKRVSNYIYDDIRKKLENPNLTNEEISTTATKAYKSAVEGCWLHKQKHFRDPAVTKENYIGNNINKWIKALQDGNTGFLALAFLDKEAERKYSFLSKDKQREIERSHITVHHKIDRKYHGLFQSWDNKKLLNNFFNLEIVIGKALHDKKHEGERNGIIIGSDEYCIAKIDKKIDNSILCVPCNENCSQARETGIDSYIPDEVKTKIAQLSADRTVKETSSRNISR